MAVEPPPVAHTPTAEQEAIYEWFRSGEGHAVVEARAGSGKTSTILTAVEHAPEDMILLAAFNSRIAKELKDRLTSDKAIAATLHSIGLQAIRRGEPRTKVEDSDKRGERAKQLTSAVVPAHTLDSVRRNITKLHSKARETMPHVASPEELIELALANDCAPLGGPSVEEIADYAFRAMMKSLEQPALVVDFADMVFRAIRLRLLKPRFRLVVVDECQDMSEPQIEVALSVLHPGGRLCAVGDSRQAIYSFRGADSHSLTRLRNELDATEFKLTTTFRCGTAIVREAQEIVPDIYPMPKAHTGLVRTATFGQIWADVKPGDFILSRLNAPLVRVSMAFLRADRRCRIEGKDVGQQLLGLSRRFSKYGASQNVDRWLEELDSWEANELRRAMKADSESRMEVVADMAQTMRVISDNCKEVADIDARISALFDDVAGTEEGESFIVCSTVHKAKGLEADNVYMLNHTFGLRVACTCGHRHFFNEGAAVRCKRPECGCDHYSPDPAAQMEEDNIRYVAITRAKRTLTYVVAGAADAAR